MSDRGVTHAAITERHEGKMDNQQQLRQRTTRAAEQWLLDALRTHCRMDARTPGVERSPTRSLAELRGMPFEVWIPLQGGLGPPSACRGHFNGSVVITPMALIESGFDGSVVLGCELITVDPTGRMVVGLGFAPSSEPSVLVIFGGQTTNPIVLPLPELDCSPSDDGDRLDRLPGSARQRKPI